MGGGAGTTGKSQAEVYGMRRKNVISRFATLVLATLACLLLAVLAPMFFGPRATDEPFSGYAVMASPRDCTSSRRRSGSSDAPDLTLNRGALYADGNAAAGTPISRFVLDGAVFYLNASGLRTNASSFEAAGQRSTGRDHAALVEQLAAMSFDALTLRRGTLHVTTADGTLGDDQRHRGGADRAAQGPARGQRQLHGRGPALVVRCHADAARRQAVRRALAAEG